MTALAPLRLKKSREAEVLQGFPWIYAGDIIESSELLTLPAGSLVFVENHKGERIGIGYYNARSQIACRVLTLKEESIDAAWFMARLKKALSLREALFREPYYRLVHSEADGLPGLLVDRFGSIVVAQAGTAGMERLQPLWLKALDEVVAPETVIFRNDISARKLEGLKEEIEIIKGIVPDAVEVHENGCLYYADLLHGQKTGWFYDQRDNRRMIAELAKGKPLIDIYSHSGGFGLLAAKAGAEVTLLDGSKLALELAKKAAARNHVTCRYIQGDAFEMMRKLADDGRRFDMVLADPPAFVKTKKDIASGLKGYEKLARLATPLVQPGGMLFIASCSHHASRGAFNNAVMAGVEKAGVASKILRQTGVGRDHPPHVKLPQSEYLKGLLLKIL